MSPKEHKRIFKRISIDEKTKCWNWIGSFDQSGYGLLWYKGRTERIHRIIYAFFNGPIPRSNIYQRELTIDHLCRNHSCCNPKHLELVKHIVNVMRGNGITAQNARKTHCKYGHQLPPYNIKHTKKRARPFCRTCDSIRHKKRMRGPQREYWLKKARESTKRWYKKHKSVIRN